MIAWIIISSSTSNGLSIKFVSDKTIAKSGFSALLVQEINECESPDHGCGQLCVNTLGSYYCTCHTGFGLHSDQKTCENACGGELNMQNGTITSPSFPYEYPKGIKCEWKITVQQNHRIALNFTHFDLEGGNKWGDCSYDQLLIQAELQDDINEYGPFCGERKLPNILTDSNQLQISFKADGDIQKSGFAINYFSDFDEVCICLRIFV